MLIAATGLWGVLAFIILLAGLTLVVLGVVVDLRRCRTELERQGVWICTGTVLLSTALAWMLFWLLPAWLSWLPWLLLLLAMAMAVNRLQGVLQPRPRGEP